MVNNRILKYSTFLMMVLVLIGCSREDMDEDVLSQEDISNIILHVKDDAGGTVKSYNYTVNAAVNPEIILANGKAYTVTIDFLNGNEDETQSILEAKDEHFLLFNFQNADIQLERNDDLRGTRTDGQRLGLKTKWKVINAKTGQDAKLILTLVHDAISVSEAQQGSVYGTVEGGETDAMATYTLSKQ